MTTAIPNGGGGEDPTTSEAAAYAASLARPAGNRTAQEQAVIEDFQGKVTAIAGSWKDTGGPGGFQAQVALEIASFVGRLEVARAASVNQWAKEAANGSRKAQSEMHGADTPFLVELARIVFELRGRLNASPY